MRRRLVSFCMRLNAVVAWYIHVGDGNTVRVKKALKTVGMRIVFSSLSDAMNEAQVVYATSSKLL